MCGVLRAKLLNASEAAPSKLPRRRVGGLEGCDDGTELTVGDTGGDGRSLKDGVVVTDCIVAGRLEFLCETDGLSIAGESEGVIGEYVTNVAAAAAEGCAAKGSVTTKSMLAI